MDLDLKSLIRTVPDFPRPGVMFRDITTLLKHPDALHAVVDGFVAAYLGRPIDKIEWIAEDLYRLTAGPCAMDVAIKDNPSRGNVVGPRSFFIDPAHGPPTDTYGGTVPKTRLFDRPSHRSSTGPPNPTLCIRRSGTGL